MNRKLFSLLKILLIIGFVYWLILVSILIYLLLTEAVAESKHLCVWIGCTFVLLVVFGAVLFLGVLVVYYIRVGDPYPDIPDYSYKNTEYWHTTPLSAFHIDLQNLVNLDTLIPILCQNQVLFCCDLESLHNLCHASRSVRIGKLIAIIEKKGKEGILGLIESLREDRQHSGHWELADILERHYGIQLAGFHRARRNEIQWA